MNPSQTMKTRRDWKSASPLSTDTQPGCSTSAQSPSSIAPYPDMSFTVRKNWTIAALLKYDDFWKVDKLITDRQMNPTRVLVDQCYANFASANVLKVLAKHGAPMKPTANIELEPLSHYVVAYFLQYNRMNYKDKKKFLEVIQYLKEEGHPLEPTLDSLMIINAPSDHEIYKMLTPPPSRDPSPSLSHSTTTSSVSTPPPFEGQQDGAAAPAAAAAAENAPEQQEPKEAGLLIAPNKRKASQARGGAKRQRLSV